MTVKDTIYSCQPDSRGWYKAKVGISSRPSGIRCSRIYRNFFILLVMDFFFQKNPTMADFRFLRTHFFWSTLYIKIFGSWNTVFFCIMKDFPVFLLLYRLRMPVLTAWPHERPYYSLKQRLSKGSRRFNNSIFLVLDGPFSSLRPHRTIRQTMLELQFRILFARLSSAQPSKQDPGP